MFKGFALVLVLLPAFQSLQSPNEPTRSPFRIGVAVDQVFLPVTARSPEGGFFRGLMKEDFLVSEDGVVQDILNFHSEALPVHVVLLVDASQSTRSIKDQISRAAVEFVESLGPEDRVAVVAFDAQPQQVVSWTSDLAHIAAGLRNVKVGGHTALFDAFSAAYDLLRGVEGRKAIVVLTDGADTGSQTTRQEVLRRSHGSEASVYVISKLDQYWAEAITARRIYPARAEPVPVQLTDAYIEENRSFLQTVAQSSGGRVLNTAAHPNLSEVYRLVAEELKNQYYLSYIPKNARRDGTWRSLDVQVGRPEVLISTKTGYYAPRSGK